jgi:hypothetical protein
VLSTFFSRSGLERDISEVYLYFQKIVIGWKLIFSRQWINECPFLGTISPNSLSDFSRTMLQFASNPSASCEINNTGNCGLSGSGIVPSDKGFGNPKSRENIMDAKWLLLIQWTAPATGIAARQNLVAIGKRLESAFG